MTLANIFISVNQGMKTIYTKHRSRDLELPYGRSGSSRLRKLKGTVPNYNVPKADAIKLSKIILYLFLSLNIRTICKT